jgi:FMN phosphatase YigB (HAD superfamily)
MIKAVIFDLDNCLSAADEVGKQRFENPFRVSKQSGHL